MSTQKFIKLNDFKGYKTETVIASDTNAGKSIVLINAFSDGEIVKFYRVYHHSTFMDWSVFETAIEYYNGI